MKTNSFVWKAIIALFMTMPLSGEAVSAQSNTAEDPEISQALNQLEVLVKNLEFSIRYKVPAEDTEFHDKYSIGSLEHLAVTYEKEMIFKAIAHPEKPLVIFAKGNEDPVDRMKSLTETSVTQVK